MAHQFPSYPSIDTGDSGLNFSDPVQEYQAVEEMGTYRDYRLGVGGADLELSDTSSCYLANPIWSPTQSYTTAETRDHLDTVESHPQTGLPVRVPSRMLSPSINKRMGWVDGKKKNRSRRARLGSIVAYQWGFQRRWKYIGTHLSIMMLKLTMIRVIQWKRPDTSARSTSRISVLARFKTTI
ncbi:hypothetical protein N7470_005132 [Penicillium chermesinum]|nr:hypothetical protein N7470_005132 [Penicillium chermesinum]